MRRFWVRELAGWFGALALAVITAAQVASSARSGLLFRDGDSLVVAMFARSIVSGESMDWAMSSVLFLPETMVFVGLDLVLPLDVNGLLAVNAVINILALYGALRLVAGRRSAGRTPVTWALLGLAAFCAIAMTELSASRDALELASLQLTTTYYAATVVAAVLSVGLVRRALDRESGGAGFLVSLGVTAAISTLSNPLYAAWATVPIAVLLALLTVRSRRRMRLLLLLGALLGGTALGVLGRIPLQAWIANTGAGYAQPERLVDSLGYYGELAADRFSTPLGLLACLIVLALLVLAAIRTARAADEGSRFVAAVAWFMPVIVVVGAIALGTHAARYLQPLAFAPVLALVAAPRAIRMPIRLRSLLAGVAAVLLAIGGIVSLPRLAATTAAPDPDLTCVTDWVSASGRTGAGQFWTVRLPKLHLDHPAQLVQVDHQLRGYAWLVNRHDFGIGEVTFLVEDAQTIPWSLPAPAIPDEVIDCGRYRILDLGDTALPLGPQRS
ncbi:MAG: hypothetical protein K0R99_2653 [Microbacterium sp.]|jgi:hypothetical protein|uniref:hypothetical protein n=1 Tax=Microbacterium sp. TaxID=51671 RepID=UPI00261BB01E|nr:hypothetical protein [Microbacterium sp.]MDF2561207.1 hypothetical protein [Microbacterium sp.]